MRETGNGNRKYFKFNEDIKYLKDIYEAEKKFRGKTFKRSKSDQTLKVKFRMDYRNTFINLPGFKDLLKEVKVLEEIEKRPTKNLEEKYEYKNLKRISVGEINQRV
jgi:general stress protein 26